MELDLKLLKMRGYLDPKKHYKKSNMKETPQYFQVSLKHTINKKVGTIVESAADFYSSRIPKKERKTHWIDELVADEELRKYTKRKVEELAKKKSSGNKESYRNRVSKRRKTFT